MWTLEAALASGNVTITTSATANGSDQGDINVNADVLWSANRLTLTAANNINARMTAKPPSTRLETSSTEPRLRLGGWLPAP